MYRTLCLYMQEFARGLRLKVSDRTKLESYVKENSNDPIGNMEMWGHNSVPEAIYIARYYDDEDLNYNTYDKHVNGEVSWHTWDEELLKEMVENGILVDDGTYDVDFVEKQEQK